MFGWFVRLVSRLFFFTGYVGLNSSFPDPLPAEEERRARSDRAARLRQEAYEKEPRLAQLDKKLQGTMSQLMAAALRRGESTAQAIQAGIVYGEADRVDGLVRRIFEQLGYEAPVVATGGLASRVAPLSRTITHVNKELTLEGLRRIYEARG